MVHAQTAAAPAATAELVTRKGKQFLRITPHAFNAPKLEDLGFTPAITDQAVCYERLFHPSYVLLLYNTFKDAGLRIHFPIQLKDMLKEQVRRNTALYSARIIDEDTSLKDYQVEACTFLAARKRAFLALAPGLGKSLCALRALQAASYVDTCIVAPLSLLNNWKQQIERWLPDTRIVRVYSDEVLKSGPRDGRRRIILMSYESFLRRYKEICKTVKFGLLIFDESILLKNRETERYAGTPKSKRNDPKYTRTPVDGVKKLVHDYVGSMWMLSGGPTAKALDDIWAQFHLIDPKRFSSYWQFAQHYCVVEEGQWGLKIVGNKPDAIDMLKRDASDVYYAKNQDEVLDLPPFIFDTIEIEMDEDQAKMYTDMEQMFLAELPSGDNVIATNVLTQILRLTQIASNGVLLEETGTIPRSSKKWDMVNSVLEYAPGPVLIWTNFIRTAALLEKSLGKKKVGVLTGQVPERERQQVVEDFQNGEIDILIAHPAVGKYGYTLTKARTVIYVERSYNGDNYYQSLYRVRRIGTTESPLIIFLLSTNKGHRTVDHAIDDILQYRHDNNVTMITAGHIRRAWAGNLVERNVIGSTV